MLEFQAQPLLEMSDGKIRSLKDIADETGIELTYSLGLDRNYDVSSLDETVRKGVQYMTVDPLFSEDKSDAKKRYYLVIYYICK